VSVPVFDSYVIYLAFPQEAVSPLIEVLPAIISYFLLGIILLYYVGGKKYYLIVFKKFTPIVVCSFLFIGSGFFIQSFYHQIIEFFTSSENKIVATIVGGFIVNFLFRYLSNQKEKKETSVLLSKNIDSQITSLGYINIWMISSYFDQVIGYIEIYKRILVNNQYHKDSFNKIGIFSNEEIEIISKYSFCLDRFLASIEKLLFDFDKENKVDKKPSFLFVITKIYLITSILIGCILVYALELKYKNPDQVLDKFSRDYKVVTQESMRPFFGFTYFYKLDKTIANEFVEILKYIRLQYKLTNPKVVNELPIHICQLLIEESIFNDKTNCLIFNVKETIISFGDSEKEAISNSENKLRNLILEGGIDDNQVEDFICKCHKKVDITPIQG
jgi:hypothetical protein